MGPSPHKGPSKRDAAHDAGAHGRRRCPAEDDEERNHTQGEGASHAWPQPRLTK